MSRRRFLAAGAIGAAAAWVPAFRSPVDAAETSRGLPPFPASVELYRQAFRNWSGEIAVDELWTCAPRTAAEVVLVANWAFRHGYRVRPRGRMHNWSPLAVVGDEGSRERVLLVDTTRHLNRMRMVAGEPRAIAVETGATMEALLGFLEREGCGLSAAPAPGDVTVGGVLAIDGHGAMVPAAGERREAGQAFGTLSNTVRSATAVVWDAGRGAYVLRTFDRSDPESAALLTHLGRAFLTEVTLQVGNLQKLRCQSLVDVPLRELFAAPTRRGLRTFGRFIEAAGRVEVVWFPFTDRPWLKVWTVCPDRPPSAREVSAPYNYPFSDQLPDAVVGTAEEIVQGHGELTPTFGRLMYAASTAGLAATASHDLWGAAKNVLLYVRPTTLRATANGYAVMTRRRDVQRVVHEFCIAHQARMAAYRARGRFPVNLPVEIRATGLDDPSQVDGVVATTPCLSAAAPRRDVPGCDVAVWFNVLTFPGTADANDFYRETERWMLDNYTAPYAAVRPEWSKGWAYGPAGAWTDSTMLTTTIPNAYRAVGEGPEDWDWAMRVLNAHDPHRIFTNPFLDALTSVTAIGPGAAAAVAGGA